MKPEKATLYSFHLEFPNGANPYYHFPCEYRAYRNALKSWEKSHDLKVLQRISKAGIVTEFYQAKERNPVNDLFTLNEAANA